jgi:hypothetical protein
MAILRMAISPFRVDDFHVGGQLPQNTAIPPSADAVVANVLYLKCRLAQTVLQLRSTTVGRRPRREPSPTGDRVQSIKANS